MAVTNKRGIVAGRKRVTRRRRKTRRKTKRRWIQKSVARMKSKGTVGSFTRWAKRRGFSGATAKAIAAGKRSRSAAIRQKANWLANVRKGRRRRRRK